MIDRLIMFLVNLKWKREHFYVYSWGIDEHTDFCIMSEESYQDWHRFGCKEEIFKVEERKDYNEDERSNLSVC